METHEKLWVVVATVQPLQDAGDDQMQHISTGVGLWADDPETVADPRRALLEGLRALVHKMEAEE